MKNCASFFVLCSLFLVLGSWCLVLGSKFEAEVEIEVKVKVKVEGINYKLRNKITYRNDCLNAWGCKVLL